MLEPDDAAARTAPVELVVTGADLVATMDVGHEVGGGWGGHRRRFCRRYWVHWQRAAGPTRPQGRRVPGYSGFGQHPSPHLPKPSPGHSGQPPARPFSTWLRALYPQWAMLDEEAVYLPAFVGLAELALGGCTTTTDHLYVHPTGGGDLLAAEIAAAGDIGLRFHPTRGSMSVSENDGGLPPDSPCC